MADLNVGEPRTVRLIYFLPSDRPYRADVVDSMKTVIRTVQSIFAEQMQAHGYGRKTFRIETDAEDKPLVHRVDGQHPESYYFQSSGGEIGEIGLIFDLYANVYFIVIDYSSANFLGAGGFGGRFGKNGGMAEITGGGSTGMNATEKWHSAAHELGHAFGLGHDFQNEAYIMSYGARRDRLSACAAKFLAVHPYFNPEIPREEEAEPGIKLISSPAYPTDSESVSIKLELTSSVGLYQVLFFSQNEMLGCRELTDVEDAVVEFDYDGKIPSDGFTSLSDPPVHSISIIAVDKKGNIGTASYPITEISPFHIATIEGHRNAVSSVSFSPDGTMLASGSWDSTIKLWEVATRRNFATLDRHKGTETTSVSFSPRWGHSRFRFTGKHRQAVGCGNRRNHRYP